MEIRNKLRMTREKRGGDNGGRKGKGLVKKLYKGPLVMNNRVRID